MKARLLVAVLIACSLAVVIACGGSSSSLSNPASPSSSVPSSSAAGTGTLTVALKDSPYSDAKAFLVTFSEVSVHASGGDWKTVAFTPAGTASRTCDLKQLQTATDILGVATLDAGHYTQIRLTVTAATLYFDTAPTMSKPCVPTSDVTLPTGIVTKADVNIPSGEIKLNREFDLAAGSQMQILLDFDGDKSIHETGNGKYQMSPVISVVSVQ